MIRPTPTREEILQKPLLEERLKFISAQLIEAHRKKNYAVLLPYAKQTGLLESASNPARLFMKLIQIYHPDRLNSLWDHIQKEATERAETLDQMAKILTYHHKAPQVRIDEDFEEEEYGFDEEDFGFGVNEVWEDDLDDEDLDIEEDLERGTFYSAIKRELFGNLEMYPEPADLRKLEGELDLSDYELHDLEGIGYCTNLSSLNLSHNHIENLYPLRNLEKLESLDLSDNFLEDADILANLFSLKELDLSGNDIDDVAFLVPLTQLRYVDLMGNPIRDKGPLGVLEQRGVIIIL